MKDEEHGCKRSSIGRANTSPTTKRAKPNSFSTDSFRRSAKKGPLDVGGKPEFRIKKAKEDGGGTSFADYVWKPLVLVEMKKRGERIVTAVRDIMAAKIKLHDGKLSGLERRTLERDVENLEQRIDQAVFDLYGVEGLPE